MNEDPHQKIQSKRPNEYPQPLRLRDLAEEEQHGNQVKHQ